MLQSSSRYIISSNSFGHPAAQATKHSPSYNLNSTILVPYYRSSISSGSNPRFRIFYLVFTGSTSHWLRPVLLFLSVVVRTPSGFLRRHKFTFYPTLVQFSFYAHFCFVYCQYGFGNLRQGFVGKNLATYSDLWVLISYSPPLRSTSRTMLELHVGCSCRCKQEYSFYSG
jgi:hypothetical protein